MRSVYKALAVAAMTGILVLSGCGGGDSSVSLTGLWMDSETGNINFFSFNHSGDRITGNFKTATGWTGTLNGAVDGNTVSITMIYSDGDTATLSGDINGEAGDLQYTYDGTASTLRLGRYELSGLWADGSGGTVDIEQDGLSVSLSFTAEGNSFVGTGTISADNITAQLTTSADPSWLSTWTMTIAEAGQIAGSFRNNSGNGGAITLSAE